VGAGPRREGGFNVNLGHLNDSGEVILKGNNSTLVVNGSLLGATGNDALTMLVEGSASGAPVLNGGDGQDSCSTSLGTVVACE
jgi:hypothetical protein